MFGSAIFSILSNLRRSSTGSIIKRRSKLIPNCLHGSSASLLIKRKSWDPFVASNNNFLKVIFSLGAGVDHILKLPSYKATPIVRVKDPTMAIKYFKKESKKGHRKAKASYELGVIYFEENSIQNYSESKKWIKKAYESNEIEISKKAEEFWNKHELWKY